MISINVTGNLMGFNGTAFIDLGLDDWSVLSTAPGSLSLIYDASSNSYDIWQKTMGGSLAPLSSLFPGYTGRPVNFLWTTSSITLESAGSDHQYTVLWDNAPGRNPFPPDGSSVPEPSTFILVGAALILAGRRKLRS